MFSHISDWGSAISDPAESQHLVTGLNSGKKTYIFFFHIRGSGQHLEREFIHVSGKGFITSLISQSASLHPGVKMGSSEFNAGGNCVRD